MYRDPERFPLVGLHATKDKANGPPPEMSAHNLTVWGAVSSANFSVFSVNTNVLY